RQGTAVAKPHQISIGANGNHGVFMRKGRLSYSDKQRERDQVEHAPHGKRNRLCDRTILFATCIFRIERLTHGMYLPNLMIFWVTAEYSAGSRATPFRALVGLTSLV